MNKSFDNFSDNELLDNFYESRNNEWLGILLQRYTLLLFGVCMKYLKNEEEAKDAVQQIFLKVINEAQRYRIDHFKSWLYTVTRNHCLMKLRSAHFKKEPEFEKALQTATDETKIQEKIEKDKLLSLIEASLPELNNEQRTCITLFYLHKLSYHDICKRTGYSLMQVKSYIQNGKRNLKLLVEKKMQ